MVGPEFVRIDQNLIFLHKTTQRSNFRNALNAFKFETHEPILKSAQLAEVLARRYEWFSIQWRVARLFKPTHQDQCGAAVRWGIAKAGEPFVSVGIMPYPFGMI